MLSASYAPRSTRRCWKIREVVEAAKRMRELNRRTALALDAMPSWMRQSSASGGTA